MEIKRENLPYRKGVNAFVRNKKGKFLVVQKIIYDDDQWDNPGGGIEKGETEENAILRELEEELGSSKFKIVKRLRAVLKYEFPDEIMNSLKYGEYFRGQIKTQFLVEFFGENDELSIQADELKNIKWITPEEFKRYFIFTDQYNDAKIALSEILN